VAAGGLPMSVLLLLVLLQPISMADTHRERLMLPNEASGESF